MSRSRIASIVRGARATVAVSASLAIGFARLIVELAEDGFICLDAVAEDLERRMGDDSD